MLGGAFIGNKPRAARSKNNSSFFISIVGLLHEIK